MKQIMKCDNKRHPKIIDNHNIETESILSTLCPIVMPLWYILDIKLVKKRTLCKILTHVHQYLKSCQKAPYLSTNSSHFEPRANFYQICTQDML